MASLLQRKQIFKTTMVIIALHCYSPFCIFPSECSSPVLLPSRPQYGQEAAADSRLVPLQILPLRKGTYYWRKYGVLHSVLPQSHSTLDTEHYF
jgi:hypothetical protein